MSLQSQVLKQEGSSPHHNDDARADHPIGFGAALAVALQAELAALDETLLRELEGAAATLSAALQGGGAESVRTVEQLA